MKVEEWCQKAFRSLSYYHFLIGFSCFIAACCGFFWKHDADEIEGVQTAWKILDGGAIYKDFFQHHHPLFYYLLVPIVKIGGETLSSLYLAEAFAFVIFTITIVVAFLLTKKVYDRKTSLISIVLLLTFPYYIRKGMEIRPDILQSLFGLTSFYLLTVYLKNRTKKCLILSALMLSLAFLSLQKAIFFVFLLGIIQLYLLLTKEIKKGDFVLYWAVFLILPTAYLSFLYITGGLGNYFDFNWLVNMKIMESFSPLNHFPLTRWSRKVFMTIIAVGLIALFIRGCFLKHGKLHKLAAFMGAGLIVSIFFAKLPYTQWFLPSAPFVVMVASAALRSLFKNSRITICLTIFVLLSACYYGKGLAKQVDKRRDNISRIQYVLSVSDTQDTIYEDSRNSLFRKDADFFWFCTRPKRCLEAYQSFRNYDYDPILIIKELQPKVIIKHKRWTVFDTNHPEIAQNYEQSSEHKLIYIRKR